MKNQIALLLIGLQVAVAAPALAVQGRDYVQRERQIVKLTKQTVKEQRETDAFRNLLVELDSIDLSESTRDFWQMARTVKDAMAEEVRQGHERIRKEGGDVQHADAAALAQLNSDKPSVGATPLEQRVERMEMIMLETDGLRNPVGMNDSSVITRYRALVGEFCSLLQAEVDEMQSEIDALKALQEAAE